MLLDPDDARPRAAARREVLGATPAATRASSSSCPPRSSRSSLPPARTVAAAASRQLAAGARATRAAPPTGIARARRRGRCTRSPPREGVLNERRALRRASGRVRRRSPAASSSSALQVHVAVRGADRALAVYNALRSHLPELAALAANAPFYEGARHGPGLGAAQAVASCCRARACRRRSRAGRSSRERWPGADARARARSRAVVVGGCACIPRIGTLEVRVPDAQATVADAAAIAAVVHALVGLARRAPRRRRGARGRRDVADRARTAGRRAATGSRATMADLRTGRASPDPRARCTRCSTSSRRGAGALGCARGAGARARAGRRGNGAAPAARAAARGRPPRGWPRCLASAGRASWRPRRVAPRHARAFPTPRGALDAVAARRACGRPPHGAADVPARVPTTRWPTTTSSSRCTCCYELHYRGFAGVDERWEWEPSLLAAARAARGASSRRALLAAVGPPPAERRRRAGARWTSRCAAIADADDGPSLSRYLERDGTREQVREFLVHRSAYQLKEADPHSWAIPRLSGRAEGRARRDPGRRVRRRAARARPRAAVRRRDATRWASTPRYGAYLDAPARASRWPP